MMEKENMLKKKKLCKGNRNVAMRKVRIFYNDADATDSSGDDESNVQTNAYGERIKRIVREVYIPVSVGVRRTRAVAEIRDPVEQKNLWLGTHATEWEAHEAYRRSKEAELNRTMCAVNKTNSSPVTSCASEETSTGLCSHSMQVFDNVEDSGKDTICLMNEPVLEDELPNVGFEQVPKLSPLLDHYSQPDSRDDLRGLTVKQLCENAFASLPSLDDEELNYEESLLQQLDPRPTRKVKMNLELDKEGRDWLKSLH